jgi:hypothetical protein
VPPCLHSGCCHCYSIVEAVLPLLGQDPLSGEEAALTHRAVASARTVVDRLVSHEGPSTTGTWQGQPCSYLRSCSWQCRTPSRGEGVRAPEPGWSSQTRGGLALTRGGTGPPWGVRVRGGHFRATCPRGHVEAPDL